MMEELRFAIRCHGSAKKPKLRRHCSQCGLHGGGSSSPGAAVAGEPSLNGVLLAQSAGASTVPRPSVGDEWLHYRRSARVDCDYAVDRRRASMRFADLDCTDRRLSGTTSELRQDAAGKTSDNLARSFAKV